MRQYGRLFLSFSFFFALFVGIVFSSPTTVSSQGSTGLRRDDIGPEVAGAGYTEGEQEALNSNLLRPQNYNGIVQIANGLDEAPYNPTPESPKVAIRVVGFDFNAEASKFAAYGSALCSSTSMFPAGTIVIVGNELNNLDLEYKGVTGGSDAQKLANAGKQYATQFNALANAVSACGQHYRVAPAPPDLYNGVWDPVPWISSFRSNGGCAGAEYLVANIFALGGSRVGLPALDAWQYLETNMCPGKKVIHFGGLGVDPNTQPPPSVKSQVDFLNAFQLPQGIETAATLIIDPCKNSNVSKSDWLFYVYGKAYDKDGNEVGEDCSTRDKPSFVYPGIEDMQSTADKNAMAASYMLTCGNKITLEGAIRGDDKLNDALPNYNSFVDDGSGGKCDPNNAACSVEAFGNVFIDNTKTVIPLFRMQDASVPRPSDPTRRTEDLEGFFSSTYTKKQTAGAADQITPLANGVSRKLTPATTQCANTMTYLNAIKQLCDEEKNRANIAINAVGTTSDSKQPPQQASPSANTSGECALYLSIPGADQRYASYRDVQARLPSVSGEQICSPKWIDTVKTRDKEWYKAFSSIEVTTPKGFKPAYIVRYMDRPEEQPSSFTSKVTWLAPSKIETDPEQIKNMTINDRIQITRVYVPAGFAEENNASVKEKRSFFPTYDGGFTQMVKSILPRDIIERIETITQLEVKSLIPKVAQYSLHTNGDKKYVQCEKCNEIDPDDYRGIIVRRINAQFSTQIGLEETGTPRFEGCTEDDYVGETAKDIVQTVNPPGVSDPVQPRKQTAVARLTAGGTGGGEPQTVRTFLLLPEEYRNINNYELAFAQTFVSHVEQEKPDFQYIAQRSDRKDPKNAYRYLQLSQSGFDISSPGVKAGAPLGININQAPEPDPNAPVDPMATPPSDTYGAEVFIEGKITGTKAVSEFNPDPQVPGGILARGLWQVMCNVLRPHDGVETIQYAGFEAFLKEGPSACTKGAKPSTTAASCKTGSDVLTCRNFGSCAPGASSSPAGTGQTAKISEGIVALALQVSKYTCTPAEILVGILAKESSGQTAQSVNGTNLVGATQTVLTGDPNEKGIRQFWSLDIYDPMNPNAPPIPAGNTNAGISPYILGGGPYQFTPDLLTRAINTQYKSATSECLSNVGITLPSGATATNDQALDNRQVGDSMCLASAVIWNGIGGTCDSTAHTLSSVSQAALEAGIRQYHLGDKNRPDDGTMTNYTSFIDRYKSFVEQVRIKQSACIK